MKRYVMFESCMGETHFGVFDNLSDARVFIAETKKLGLGARLARKSEYDKHNR